MSTPTWTHTRTPLVLALAIATAVAFIQTSHAQDLFQGIEQIAGPLAQIWPEFRPDIEEQTNSFKESTLEQIRALMDMIIFNRMAEILEKIKPELQSEIEEKKNNYTRSKGSTQDKFQELVDLTICKKCDNAINRKGNVAIDLVPRRRQDNSESILLIDNSQIESDIRHWTMSLDETISLYEQKSFYYVQDCNEDRPGDVANGLVCRFDTDLLAHFLRSHCSVHNDWGYTTKSPCIIVEMQKIPNWKPDVYTSIEELPYDMPEDLQAHINEVTNENSGNVPKMLWLNCKGSTPEDDENVGEVKYTSWRGFPAYYFPYAYIGNDDWQAPLVAVKFNTPAKNVLINIECRVYAKNIDHLRDDSPDSVYGVMNFELLI